MVKKVGSENTIWGKEFPNTCWGLYYMTDTHKNGEGTVFTMLWNVACCGKEFENILGPRISDFFYINTTLSKLV